MNESQLIQIITQAFQDVILEEGIGLSEANAIDDYQTAEVKAACRAIDEKENWMLITSADLNKYYCSLSFFDAKGMRFHLPAFMIAEIKREFFSGLAFTLTHLSDHTQSQFVLLNTEQREAVKLFLNWLQGHPDYEYESPTINKAMKGYWN